MFILYVKWHCGFCFKIQFSWFLPSIGIEVSSAGQKYSHFKDPVEMLQEENNPGKNLFIKYKDVQPAISFIADCV